MYTKLKDLKLYTHKNEIIRVHWILEQLNFVYLFTNYKYSENINVSTKTNSFFFYFDDWIVNEKHNIIY